MNWMDWKERVLYTIAVLLIGTVIGAQWHMRDTRKKVATLENRIEYLESMKIDNAGDVVVTYSKEGE